MRIIVDGTEYEALASTAMYETDYEAILVRWAPQIFPGWYTVPFKVSVSGVQGVRIPDLALVATDLSKWCVVEVEMAHHPIDAHVLPQVETFCTGAYGEPHANALAKFLPDIEATRILDMVREIHPNVHVIVNVEIPSWLGPLAQTGATLSVVEIYRSDRDAVALRVSGQEPAHPRTGYTRIVRDSIVSNAFRVKDQRLLSLLAKELSVRIDGRITQWQRPSLAHELIVPVGGDPVEGRNSLLISYDLNGLIHINTNQPDI